MSESVRQQAYLNLKGVVPFPADYWHNRRSLYDVTHLYNQPAIYKAVMSLTPNQACRIGLEDVVLRQTQKLKEEYEHLYRTL